MPELRKVAAGDPLSTLSASTWNALVDAAADGGENLLGGAARYGGPAAGVVQVKNASTSLLGRFHAAVLSAPRLTPANQSRGWTEPELQAWDVVKPTAGTITKPFVILQAPAPAHSDSAKRPAVDALLAGVTPVKLFVVDEAHAYAGLDSVETKYLRTAASGPAEILWKEAGTGEKWAIVRLGNNVLSAPIAIVEIVGAAAVGDPASANTYGIWQGRAIRAVDPTHTGFGYFGAYSGPDPATTPFIPAEDVAVVALGRFRGSEWRDASLSLGWPPTLIHGDRFVGYLVGSSAYWVDPGPGAVRPLYAIRPPETQQIFYNASGETVPSWAVMKVSGYRTVGAASELVVDVVKPNDEFGRSYLVNSERPVPAGQCGRAQQGPLVIAESTGIIGAGFGARVGPHKTSAWKIAEGGYGFRWLGQQPLGASNYTQYQQDPPEVLLCEATADITAGSTGNVTYKILDAPGNILYGPGAGKVPNLTNRTNTKVSTGHKFYAWLSTDLTAEVLSPTQKFVAP